VGLSHLMGYRPSPFVNWISNITADINKGLKKKHAQIRFHLKIQHY